MINKERWDNLVKINVDPYSKTCVDVAREVMRMLDEEKEPLKKGYHPQKNTAHSLICRADDKINAGGITGFMAGAVCGMVKECHVRGEEFYNSFRD